MYYLAIFSKAEMKKVMKQWKASNTSLQLEPDFGWDMVKTQGAISNEHYADLSAEAHQLQCQQSSQMQLQTDDDYKFLILNNEKDTSYLYLKVVCLKWLAGMVDCWGDTARDRMAHRVATVRSYMKEPAVNVRMISHTYLGKSHLNLESRLR
ncbi:hypothetical protein EDC04DRAFT_2598025 [Pisolithus marmoratus]|nr:hypothetical protein EDC04DRAFT_2598025 [Pisolithus marmoratus]